MKKNILFIMSNLWCGGAEKALISLLENIDYEKYKVDLFLFKHEGMFLKSLPKEVNLLPEEPNYKYFDMSIKNALPILLRNRQIKIAIARILYFIVERIEKNKNILSQRVWKYVSTSFKKLDKEYDLAIGFLEKNPIFFCVDKVYANKKVGWIHNDYEKLGIHYKIDCKYFDKLDRVFTVSDECLNILKRRFPQYNDKFRVMHNIIPERTIKRLSTEIVEDIKFNNKCINIVSIGRLTYQKGFDIAIDACKILVDKKYKIQWIIIGDGEERKLLQHKLEENNLTNNFILIGLRDNPYKYVSNSDIYVQPSRFEGKSIAIDEAKILAKPIVTTNFSTVVDQIENNKNGIIVEKTAESIAEGIEKIIIDNNLKNNLIGNLIKEENRSANEINVFYDVLEK